MEFWKRISPFFFDFTINSDLTLRFGSGTEAKDNDTPKMKFK